MPPSEAHSFVVWEGIVAIFAKAGVDVVVYSVVDIEGICLGSECNPSCRGGRIITL